MHMPSAVRPWRHFPYAHIRIPTPFLVAPSVKPPPALRQRLSVCTNITTMPNCQGQQHYFCSALAPRELCLDSGAHARAHALRSRRLAHGTQQVLPACVQLHTAPPRTPALHPLTAPATRREALPVRPSTRFRAPYRVPDPALTTTLRRPRAPQRRARRHQRSVDTLVDGGHLLRLWAR
jgi:hypothetical protein